MCIKTLASLHDVFLQFFQYHNSLATPKIQKLDLLWPALFLIRLRMLDIILVVKSIHASPLHSGVLQVDIDELLTIVNTKLLFVKR